MLANPPMPDDAEARARLNQIQQKSNLRRSLLMKQFSVSSVKDLRAILGPHCLFKDEGAIIKSYTFPTRWRRKLLQRKQSKAQTSTKKDTPNDSLEYTEYKDSTTFLKGNQSSNPHNDYCQHFVDTGDRPQNFIRDTGLKHRFEEYPKLRELIRLKDDQISKTATPPMYLQCDLATFDLTKLECKFDVILIEPPLEEYNTSNGVIYDRYWSWSEIEKLKIEDISAQRSFCWIWCGSGEGLDEARKCLQKWGFRRCEDICWIKSNRTRPGHKNLEGDAVFQRTKEHCLMGIKGTVKRSLDGDFIHANVDIDLIIDEEPPYGVKEKPVEIFHIIEHFCLGRRRLHVFGRDNTLRPGWLSVGSELSASNFDSRVYSGYFTQDGQGHLTGSTEDIERLRPKSPPPRGKPNPGQEDGGGGISLASTSSSNMPGSSADLAAKNLVNRHGPAIPMGVFPSGPGHLPMAGAHLMSANSLSSLTAAGVLSMLNMLPQSATLLPLYTNRSLLGGLASSLPSGGLHSSPFLSSGGSVGVGSSSFPSNYPHNLLFNPFGQPGLSNSSAIRLSTGGLSLPYSLGGSSASSMGLNFSRSSSGSQSGSAQQRQSYARSSSRRA